jgi:hypothetical protein
MQIDPCEMEHLVEAASRRAGTDQVAIALVEAVVLAAMSLYFVASALSWAFA